MDNGNLQSWNLQLPDQLLVCSYLRYFESPRDGIGIEASNWSQYVVRVPFWVQIILISPHDKTFDVDGIFPSNYIRHIYFGNAMYILNLWIFKVIL